MKVYQHPSLVPRYEPLEAASAIEQCPKLAKVVQCLRDIQKRGEKALVFTRSLNMQQILASIIGAEFNLNVPQPQAPGAALSPVHRKFGPESVCVPPMNAPSKVRLLASIVPCMMNVFVAVN